MSRDAGRHSALPRFARAVRRVSQLCGYVAAGLVALAVVVVCHMVFVRYVLNQSTIWQTDLITYCITAPGENALWFMYEPVLMSKKSFSRLDKKQQDVLLAAGKKAEAYFAKEAPGLDEEMVKAFKQHNVEVVTLTPAEYDQWLKVAQQSSYAEFAKEVPSGKKLIDEALAVK